MARIELDRVVTRRPSAYGTLFERGRAWLALGDAERAAADFGAAINGMSRPTPEHVIARRDVLLSLGRRSEALTALEAGLARIGPAVSLELAAVDLEVELGRYDAALARLDRLLGRSTVSPAWVVRRGEVLERAGRPVEARVEYARALALIDARDTRRSATTFTDLRRRLETALAPAPREREPKGDSR
jgi:tetratricopeptide (TPR) repeat protein